MLPDRSCFLGVLQLGKSWKGKEHVERTEVAVRAELKFWPKGRVWQCAAQTSCKTKHDNEFTEANEMRRMQ